MLKIANKFKRIKHMYCFIELIKKYKLNSPKD